MARSESLDIGTPDREALFASSEGVKWPIDSSHCSWISTKAKVARSECEVDGASDLEALFASLGRSEAEHSSHCSWIPLKAKVARSQVTNKRKRPAFHQSEATSSYLRFFSS